MRFLKECEVVPVFEDMSVEGSNIRDTRMVRYGPGLTHYYINGEEVTEEEYEYFYNAQYNDNFKEQNEF